MQLVGNQQILNLGLKYTTKLNKRRLSEKLMEWAAVLQEESKDADEAPKAFHSGGSTMVGASEVVFLGSIWRFLGNGNAGSSSN